MMIVIPAKRGSKRLPEKNFIPFFLGESLVDLAVKQALAILFPTETKVVVSTEAPGYTPPAGVTCVVHSPDLCQSTESTWNAVEHACYTMGYFGTVMVLQPTSPLRSLDDIRACLRLLGETSQNVTSTHKGNYPNGAVYIRHWKRWHDVGIIYHMPWHRSCDIDTGADFEIAKSIFEERRNKQADAYVKAVVHSP